jgi:hypothetical protein
MLVQGPALRNGSPASATPRFKTAHALLLSITGEAQAIPTTALNYVHPHRRKPGVPGQTTSPSAAKYVARHACGQSAVRLQLSFVQRPPSQRRHLPPQVMLNVRDER